MAATAASRIVDRHGRPFTAAPPAARRARSHRPRDNELQLAVEQLVTLRQHGWTPATIALAGQETIAAALTAAATRVETRTSQDLRRLIQPWQARALTYYDMIGEVNFSSQFYSRSLAKIRLFPALLDDNGDAQQTDDPTLIELWDRVQDPGGGRAEIQASYGRLMFITGEGYLTCTPDQDWGEVWEFLSPDELRVQPGGLYVRYRAPQIGTQEYVNAPDVALEPKEGAGVSPDEIIAYRLWKKHPRYSWWADSSMHAVLDILEELLLLTLAVRSQAKSRAANNGILLWPDEISNPQLDTEGDEDPLNDPLYEDFTSAWLAPIADPGSAGAGVPLFVRMAAELIPEAKGGPRFLKFDANDSYAENGMRTELIRRYAMGVDLPPEQLLGMAEANHWPCAEDTEVFTRDRGFVTHDQLSEGDTVLSLDHDTGETEWSEISGVRREHVTDLEMVRVLTPSVDALTTLEHRWPVLRDGERVWTSGEGLLPADRIIRAGSHRGLPIVPIHSDAFVRLVAWYVTEGTCTWPDRRHCQVRIGQSHARNPQRVAELQQTLASVYGPASRTLVRPPGTPVGARVAPAWREHAEPRGMTLFHLNKTAYEPVLDAMESWRSKVVSRAFVESLTRDQLILFLETAATGDGNLSKQGGLSINQRDPRRLEPLALAAILAGRPASFASRSQTGGFSDGQQHYLNVPITRGYDVPVGATTRETYTGVIFCPKVPVNRSFLARRNGTTYFTGNSGWLIDEQSWKAHLMPVTQQMANDFNSAYLRPAAREEGFKDWKRVVIGYDATEVINHPDRGKDAQDAYDRRAIGKKALRDAKGFDDEDAPTDDELNEMIGVQIRDGSLALFGIPQIRGTGVEPEPGEVESTGGGETVAPAGPATGADVEPGPPPEGAPDPRTPITAAALAAARVIGAAEAAVDRCRELAGSKLVTRVRNARCTDCLTRIDGIAPALVASALGPDTLEAIKAPQADKLVAGGSRLFAAAGSRFGLNGHTADLAALIEQHAADTLTLEHPPPLPQAFHDLLAKATTDA